MSYSVLAALDTEPGSMYWAKFVPQERPGMSFRMRKEVSGGAEGAGPLNPQKWRKG